MVPVATALGVDPIHFGIIMTCNLAIGMVTPPMGINLLLHPARQNSYAETCPFRRSLPRYIPDFPRS